MRTLPTDSSDALSLEPQVFSTDTDRRFALLIFTILSTSLYIFRSELLTQFLGLIPSLPWTRFLNAQYTSCISSSLLGASASVASPGGLAYQCSWQADLLLLVLLFMGELAVLGLAGLIYWLFPTWKCWREHLEPLPEGDLAVVIRELERLRQQYIPFVRLRYVWNPFSPYGIPMIFSGLGRHYFLASNGMIKLLQKDPSAFQAVALHEMAHVYNKDARKFYFAIAISCSFLLIALLPFVGILLWALVSLHSNLVADNGFALSEFVGVFAMLLLGYGIFTAIVRSREVYADIQSVRWVGSPEALADALDKLAREEGVSTHPGSHVRQRYIQEPQRAFGLKYWEALAIGIAFGAALPSIHDTFSMIGRVLLGLGVNMPYSLEYPDVGTLLLCLFVAFMIGQMLWRAILIASTPEQRGNGAGRFGLCLAAGLVLGFALSIYTTPLVVFYKVNNWQVVVSYAVFWLLLLAAGLSGFCGWLALVGSLWLGVVDTPGLRRWISWVSFVLAGIILAVGFALFSLFVLTNLGFLLSSQPGQSIFASSVPLQPVSNIAFYLLIAEILFVEFLQRFYLLATFMLLWVLPLVAYFWYRRKASLLHNPFRPRLVIYVVLAVCLLFLDLAPAIPPGGISNLNSQCRDCHSWTVYVDCIFPGLSCDDHRQANASCWNYQWAFGRVPEWISAVRWYVCYLLHSGCGVW